METSPPGRGLATLLGFAGLIPFVGLAAAALTGFAPTGVDPVFALGAYGATILSFLGGVQWGFVLSPGRPAGVKYGALRLALGVLPQLIGWAALLLAPPASLLVLAVALAGHLVVDWTASRAGLAPSWFLSLRTPLSLGAAASLLAAVLL